MAPNSSQHILAMKSQPELEAQAFESLLAMALREFVAELFFTDAGLLIGYINAGQANNIEDIVASSAERSLKAGTLRYGRHAVTESDWGQPPTVSMDLEFHHSTLSVYFKLVFDATSVGVAIDSIDFRRPCHNHDDGIGLLRAALHDASIPH